MRKIVVGVVLLLAIPALIGCGDTMRAYQGAPLPQSEVATIAGGELPNVTAVDGLPVGSDPPLGQPTITLLPGPHLLAIRYQPCTTYNNCGLAPVVADVVLVAGRTYELRQRTKGCSFLEGLAWFWPGAEEEACRTYLWIEDGASGKAVWGERPVS